MDIKYWGATFIPPREKIYDDINYKRVIKDAILDEKNEMRQKQLLHLFDRVFNEVRVNEHISKRKEKSSPVTLV